MAELPACSSNVDGFVHLRPVDHGAEGQQEPKGGDDLRAFLEEAKAMGKFRGQESSARDWDSSGWIGHRR